MGKKVHKFQNCEFNIFKLCTYHSYSSYINASVLKFTENLDSVRFSIFVLDMLGLASEASESYGERKFIDLKAVNLILLILCIAILYTNRYVLRSLHKN